MAKLNLSVQDDTEESELKYRAPALEKGLDIVELLAASPKPMPPRQISEQLNRSVSELFRMIAVLEHRGYVAMAENQSGYELTNKLFSLGMSRGVSKNLLDYAIPAIRALSDEILQATHIVVASDDQVVVIGQMDAPAAPSFHVRVGYRQEIVEATAGTVLYAFQTPTSKAAWRKALQPTVSESEWARFEQQAIRARENGFLIAQSAYSESITDIACPVFNDRGLVAAITIPYIRSKLSISVEDCANALVDTCTSLSNALGAAPRETF
ncbi:IclR family transcriptional regulator [Asticcacaulis sp.]|uniref:IclR family transcriptional regulator n=1 Tax=Asticcacaulis sp. TaxID=1872648 RepID=UPI003F7BFF9D